MNRKPQYVKGKDGKFKGSIGQGKTTVPTVKPEPAPLIVKNPDVPETPLPQGQLRMISLTPNPRLLERFASNPDPRIRATVAENKHTPEQVLDTLADDKVEFVRAGVARNVKCPARLLRHFARTERNWAFRQEVAYNLGCPPDVLENLSDDVDRDVRVAVSLHPKTPEHVLRRWVSDDDLSYGVAANIGSPADVLVELSYNRQVRWEVAENPATPVPALKRLAGDDEEFIRRQVASNKACPSPIVDWLALDDEPTVAEAARNNPNYTGGWR